MAINETNIFFEGFLRKRKDTMRVRWATYWFRLQNATLFFYTRKNGNALNLRGNYYIYTVQSVREVHKAKSKHFLFEINMNNGKRKLLKTKTIGSLSEEFSAREDRKRGWTAGLGCRNCRTETALGSAPLAGHASLYVTDHNLQMHTEKCDQQQTEESDVVRSPPPHPLPAPPDRAQYEDLTHRSQTNLPEANICRNIPPACDYHVSEEEIYVFIRKGECEDRTEMENLYDVPLSNRRAAIPPVDTENIYDVPSSLLRKIPDHTLAFSSEEQQTEEAHWRI